MKYIKIKNNGLIEPEALSLLGASSKRNDNTKIGSFGSGNKFAIAYLLRNDYALKIFAGENEIPITVTPSHFRGQDFGIISINGKETSITTEMGKDWQLWQSLREIYCNALDEGGGVFEYVNAIAPVEGETHFYIQTQKDISEFVANFDNYFAENKKVLFQCEQGRILEKTGDTGNIYRKGIRCHNSNKKSVYDYDFTEIGIDENRLVRSTWQVQEQMWDLIFRCDNEYVIHNILHNSHDHDFMEGTASDYITINSSGMSETFKNVLRSNNIASRGAINLLKPDEIENHILIPQKVWQSVRGTLKDENVPDKFKTGKRGGLFREIETSALYQATLDKALEFLKEVGYEVNYPIITVLFEDKDIFGGAIDDTILLSDMCLESGVNTVVRAIIEENTHLKYNVRDETRGFQTAIITDFVSYMKKQNSFVI